MKGSQGATRLVHRFPDPLAYERPAIHGRTPDKINIPPPPPPRNGILLRLRPFNSLSLDKRARRGSRYHDEGLCDRPTDRTSDDRHDKLRNVLLPAAGPGPTLISAGMNSFTSGNSLSNLSSSASPVPVMLISPPLGPDDAVRVSIEGKPPAEEKSPRREDDEGSGRGGGVDVPSTSEGGGECARAEISERRVAAQRASACARVQGRTSEVREISARELEGVGRARDVIRVEERGVAAWGEARRTMGSKGQRDACAGKGRPVFGGRLE